MSRAVPFCRSLLVAFTGGLASDPTVTAIRPASAMTDRDAEALLCIGSHCSDYLPASDTTPAANLMVCGRNPTAPPWIDPAAEEGK